MTGVSVFPTQSAMALRGSTSPAERSSPRLAQAMDTPRATFTNRARRLRGSLQGLLPAYYNYNKLGVVLGQRWNAVPGARWRYARFRWQFLPGPGPSRNHLGAGFFVWERLDGQRYRHLRYAPSVPALRRTRHLWTVPYGDVDNETVVTFTNAPDQPSSRSARGRPLKTQTSRARRSASPDPTVRSPELQAWSSCRSP